MNAEKAEALAREALGAKLKLHSLFASSPSIEDLLDTFWCLQDVLSRLLDMASDAPRETLRVVQQTCPRMVPDIIALLSFTSKTSFRRNVAIRNSCEAINNSLVNLMELKESSRDFAGHA
jgi:hypothetical protein